MKKILLIIALCATALVSKAENFDYDSDIYERQMFVSGQDTLLYRIAYPENFNPKKKYPVVLFMHGAGDRGNNNIRQLILGGQFFISEPVRKDYPAIVIYPQCPATEMWTKRRKEQPSKDAEWVFTFPVEEEIPTSAKLVNLLMDDVIAKPYTDQRRIYIMGISMGGIGTLDFLYRWEEKYAAAVIICGAHDVRYADTYKNAPVWFLHGDADNVVPMHYSKEIYEAIKDGNKNTRYTVFPGADHSIWNQTFSQPDLLEWTFSNKKDKKK